MNARWWILICCCIIGFTSDFYIEEPSTLAQRLTGTASACANQTDHCTYLSITQFNFLSSARSWASAFGAIFVGFIIDRYGCRNALLVCAAGILATGLLFASGTYFAQAFDVFATLLTANITGGLCAGAGSVIIHRVKSSWFFYKELALSFSIHIVFSRLGSAAAFLVIGGLIDVIGMQACLWIGAVMMLLAAIACVVVALFETKGSALVISSTPEISPALVWTFFTSQDGLFWCFSVMVALSYGCVAAFSANGPNFIAKVYGYSESDASYLAGIVFDISLFSIFFGWLTDRYGRRENWMLSSAIMFFLAFTLELSIPKFPAWLLTTLIGVGYATFGPIFWSSIPLVVSPNYVGTALGFMKFCCYAGNGIFTALAGLLLGTTSSSDNIPWLSLIIMLVVTSGFGLIVTSLMFYLNIKTERRLTPSQKMRDLGNALREITPLISADNGSVSSAHVPLGKNLP